MAALGGGVAADLHERDATRPPPQAAWRVALASEEARFGGGGTGWELDGAGALRLQGPGAVLLRAEAAR